MISSVVHATQPEPASAVCEVYCVERRDSRKGMSWMPREKRERRRKEAGCEVGRWERAGVGMLARRERL